MRNIFLIIVFLAIVINSWGQETSGTRVTSVIVPNDSSDIYSTHDDYFGAGGYRVVNTIDEMVDIPEPRRKTGMLVYVKDDSTIYQLKTNGYQLLSFSKDSINNLLVTQRLKVKALSGAYQVTFPFQVLDSAGYNRAAISSKGLLITGRQHNSTVNVDALANIGAKNSILGADAFAFGKNVSANNDSSMAIGFNLTSPVSSTVKIGRGSNYITFDDDSMRFYGNYARGGESPADGFFKWSSDSNCYVPYPDFESAKNGSFYYDYGLALKDTGFSVNYSDIGEVFKVDRGTFYYNTDQGLGFNVDNESVSIFGAYSSIDLNSNDVTISKSDDIKSMYLTISPDKFNFNSSIVSNTKGSLYINNYGLIGQINDQYNTSFGDSALTKTANNGAFNAAFGYYSLNNNSSGSVNTAIGYMPLANNITGSGNTAIGGSALTLNTTGSYNTGIGYGAMLNNTVGGWNTVIGHQALTSNTTGNYNIAIGYGSGYNNTTESHMGYIGTFKRGSKLDDTTKTIIRFKENSDPLLSKLYHNARTYTKLSSTTNYASVGGVIKDFYTDVSTSGTSETDLYSYTVPANILLNNGDKLSLSVTLDATFDAVTGAYIKLYFAGSSITFISNESISGYSQLTFDIIRVSASACRVSAHGTINSTTSVKYSEFTSKDWTTANILKITGQAGGGTLTAKMGTIEFKPASIN